MHGQVAPTPQPAAQARTNYDPADVLLRVSQEQAVRSDALEGPPLVGSREVSPSYARQYDMCPRRGRSCMRWEQCRSWSHGLRRSSAVTACDRTLNIYPHMDARNTAVYMSGWSACTTWRVLDALTSTASLVHSSTCSIHMTPRP